MIKNEKQYSVTKNKLKEFEAALLEIEKKADTDPLLKKLQVASIISQIDDFKNEITEYENVKEGLVNVISVESVDDLHEILIKGRLAKGWSQGQLAERLEMKEQQIQRYEACNYSTASLPRLIQVANVLGVVFYPIRAKISDPIFHLPDDIDRECISIAQRKLQQRKTLIAI